MGLHEEEIPEEETQISSSTLDDLSFLFFF
jgi:hypothetical protein